MVEGKMSAESNDSEATLRKMLASLDVQKKAMEHEADAILFELTNPPSEGVEPMGIDTPLVDKEGYPRADIDVYRARAQRNRFQILKTDHKEMQGKIEGLLLQLASLKNPSKKIAEAEEKELRLAPKPLPKYDTVTGKWVVKNWDGSVSGVDGGDRLKFENLSQNREILNPNGCDPASSSIQNGDESFANGLVGVDIGSVSLQTASDSVTGTFEAQNWRPFAKVDAIAKESPAEKAGLHVGDLVTRFGSLHANNHDRLRALAKLVPEVAGEGGVIQLMVLRRCSSSSSVEESGNSDHHITAYNDETKWEKMMLSLRPRPFAGRGLLGCHIIPVD